MRNDKNNKRSTYIQFPIIRSAVLHSEVDIMKTVTYKAEVYVLDQDIEQYLYDKGELRRRDPQLADVPEERIEEVAEILAMEELKREKNPLYLLEQQSIIEGVPQEDCEHNNIETDGLTYSTCLDCGKHTEHPDL